LEPRQFFWERQDDNGGKIGWIGFHGPVQQRIAAANPAFPDSSKYPV
jgi:hypothetical protein